MAKRSMFVGMDVHKESIDISLAEEGRHGEVRHYGVIPGDLEVEKPSRALWTSAPSIRPCLRRGSSATNHRLGGTQAADISSVNRR